MSSIKPNNGSREMYGGEEIRRRFVVASGDSPELLEFTKEILDEVPRLVEFVVMAARGNPIVLGRDDCGFSCGFQHLDCTRPVKAAAGILAEAG